MVIYTPERHPATTATYKGPIETSPLHPQVTNLDGTTVDPLVFTTSNDLTSFSLLISCTMFGKADTYQLRFLAENDGYDNQVSIDFTVTLIDPCEFSVLTIDPTILSSIDIQYKIGYEADVQLLELAKVTSNETIAACPDVILEIYNSVDQSPYDSDVFTYNTLQEEFQTYNEDFDKAGEYELTLRVSNAGYDNYSTLAFKVTLIHPCENAVFDLSLLTTALFTDDIVYDINDEEIIKTIDPSLVQSLEVKVTCPNILIDIVN